MQYLVIDTMENEDFNKYCDKLSSFDETKELTIIIDSPGGSSDVRQFLFNELQRFNYSIQAYTCFSNALILFDMLRNKAKSIYISPTGQFMAHICTFPINTGNKGVTRGDYEKYKKELNEISPDYEFSFLTKEQKERYNKGEDVYILPTQIINI